MMLSIIHSRANSGMRAPPVTIEIHISNGLPHLSIVGLPEAAVKESKDRVRSALMNVQYEFPGRRITINLAPADLPKEGSRFDLPIAIGILAASGQIPTEELDNYELAGELGLTGELRSIHGALPLALATQRAKRQLILPKANSEELSVLKSIKAFPAQHLLEVCQHFSKKRLLDCLCPLLIPKRKPTYPVDMSEVIGQNYPKRALEIAAAGGHSVLLVGPPGTGKTMLANALLSILPPMTEQEALEVAMIRSIKKKSGKKDYHTWGYRPFRAPHHTASSVALVGGGRPPKPGEISLAHNGVLFLDELPEFNRHVLETLRVPLESGQIVISRAAHQEEFPASFQLMASMNPCPCGYLTDPVRTCYCTTDQIQRYRSRLSGPILDRIHMAIEVPRVKQADLMRKAANDEQENSKTIQARVCAARKQQLKRSKKINAKLSNQEIATVCQLTPSDKEWLVTYLDQKHLSTRAYYSILKLARTIADIEQGKNITLVHLTEATTYRVEKVTSQ